jgi:hypothetical protein
LIYLPVSSLDGRQDLPPGEKKNRRSISNIESC